MKAFVVVMLSIFLVGTYLLLDNGVAAEKYPVKPITFIMPLEAGSDGDVLLRPLCQKASAIIGQPLIIVNKPGAGSTIGFRELHEAKPDGYTIGYGAVTLIINKYQGIIPYDHDGFVLMGTYATYVPIIVASAKTQRPFQSMQEVLSFAKSRPGEVSIATSGVGQSWWVATMAFQAGTGLQFNIIPQAGTGAFSIAQAAGGHTDLAILAMGAAKPQIEAGNVRFLAVFGSRKAPGYEHVPTLKDLGYDIAWESTQLLMGPLKMPKDATEKLVNAFRVAASDPEYHKFVIERNAVPFYLPPDKSLQYFDEQRKVVRGVMDKAGILKVK